MTTGVQIVRGSAMRSMPGAPERDGLVRPIVGLELRLPDRMVTLVVESAAAPVIPGIAGLNGSGEVDEHLVADSSATGARGLQIADVIVAGGTGPHKEPTAWISEAFDQHPACLVCAVTGAEGSGLLGIQGGWTMRLSAAAGGRLTPCETSICASFLHSWLAMGGRLTALGGATLEIEFGGRRLRRLSVGRADPEGHPNVHGPVLPGSRRPW